MPPFTTAGRLVRPSLLLLLATPMLLGGCSGFYTMYPVQLRSTVPALERERSAASHPPDGAVPYLTLRAYSHTQNFLKNKSDVNHQLEIFNLKASFKPPGAADPVDAVIMSLNVKTGAAGASGGEEFFRSLPVIASSNQSFDLSLTSTAVEGNLADTFNKVLSAVSNATGPLLSSAAPQADVALGMVTKILSNFKSSEKGTEFEVKETLNPTAGAKEGYLAGEVKVMIIVPTGETLSQSQVSTINQTPNEKTEYGHRISALQRLQFVLCDTGKELCVVDPATKAVSTFDQYAYVLFVPTISYRVTYPALFWPTLGSGSCTLTEEQLRKSSAATTSAWEAGRLTSSQFQLELEIERSAEKLLEVRSALSLADKKAGATALFEALDKEWHRRRSTDGLYTFKDVAGRSYSDTQSVLRNCMRDDALGGPGLIAADYLYAVEASLRSLDEKEPAKKLDLYNDALRFLHSVRKDFTDRKLDLPGRLQDISLLEDKVLELEFAPLFAAARSADAAAKKTAIEKLTGLVLQTPCASCRTQAQVVMREAGSTVPSGMLARLSDTAGAVAEAQGALALDKLRDSENQIDPTTRQSIEDSLENASKAMSEVVALTATPSKSLEAQTKLIAATKQVTEACGLLTGKKQRETAR